MEEKNSLCWCGSGKAYVDCHQMIDAKIELLRSQGKEVPERCMIKTPEQIAGIREACKINTGVLDEVAKYIKAGMTTEQINTHAVTAKLGHHAVAMLVRQLGHSRANVADITPGLGGSDALQQTLLSDSYQISGRLAHLANHKHAGGVSIIALVNRGHIHVHDIATF